METKPTKHPRTLRAKIGREIWEKAFAEGRSHGKEEGYQDIASRIKEVPCAGCGSHPTIWATMMKSPEWAMWYKHASENMLFDVDETQELGCMSAEHFKAFIAQVKDEAYDLGYETALNKMAQDSTKGKRPKKAEILG